MWPLTFKDVKLFDGSLNGSVTQPQANRYDGQAAYLFRNGDSLGANLLLGTQPLSIERYGLNGQFGLDSGGTGQLKFEALPPLSTYTFNTDFKFGNGNTLATDLINSPAGLNVGANGTFGLGNGGNGTGEVRYDGPNQTVSANTGLTFGNGSTFNGDLTNSPAGLILGANGTFGLGNGGNGTGEVRYDGPNQTVSANTGLTFGNGNTFNGDLTNSPAGLNLGANGTFGLGNGGNGTGEVRYDGPNQTVSANTGLTFGNGNTFNGDLTNSPVGLNLGANGTFGLGNGGKGTGEVRYDGPNQTVSANTGLVFGNGNTFNADLTNSLAGLNLGANGTFGLGNGGKGTGEVRYDGANQTVSANTGLTFGNGNTFNADLTNSLAGLNVGANGTFGLGNGGKGSGEVRYDGPNQTFSANTGLTFGNGNTFNADVTKGPNGSIYGADGTFGIGNGTGLAGFRINEPEGTSAYSLAARFGKDQYNLDYATSPAGNTFGAGAQFGFANEKGAVNLNGTFGPKLSELTGGVVYKDKGLEYSGNFKLNNEAGGFGLAEIGGKLSKGNDREKFSIEGNYKPQNNEYSVMLSYTLSFGGGSRHRTAAPTAQASSQQLDVEVANFRDKQAIAMLNPQDRKLYDQAAAGVEKLNAAGANLPVRETAASLAALANQRGLGRIDEVSLGNPTAGGRHNLFIVEGNSRDPAAKSASIDSAQAAATPVQSSTWTLQRTPDLPEAQAAAVTQDNPQLATPKRAAH
jgi:hypothetical protein